MALVTEVGRLLVQTDQTPLFQGQIFQPSPQLAEARARLNKMVVKATAVLAVALVAIMAERREAERRDKEAPEALAPIDAVAGAVEHPLLAVTVLVDMDQELVAQAATGRHPPSQAHR